jgi:hypothetical protein
MLDRLKYGIALLGAAGLASSVFTGALASTPTPFRSDVRTAANQTVQGSLTVNNVLHVNKNTSVSGRLYAHGGEQVWKTLTVKQGGLDVTGGTKTDSLTTPTLSVTQQATISGNASVSGALTAGSVTSTGAITAPGLTLNANGKMGTLGLDGNGNVTLGSLVASGGLTAGSLTTAGALSAGSVNSTGTITAGGLTVTGNVDLSHANVTGLNFSNLNLQNLTLSQLALGNASGTTSPLALTENGQTETLGVDTSGNLTVRSLAVSNTFTAGSANFSALSLGSTSSTSPALTLNGNGKSTQLGVDANGNLTASGFATSGSVNVTGGLAVGGNATVGGSLTVTGTGGLVAGTIAGPPASSSSTTPGALTLTGSTVGLNGATTVSGGNDLSLSTTGSGSSTSSSHLLAGGSRDVAGITTLMFGSPGYATGATGTQTVCFSKTFVTQPIVTITAYKDPAPGAAGAPPKVFVDTFGPGNSVCPAGGFTINYTAPMVVTPPTTPPTIQYFYHVIGS